MLNYELLVLFLNRKVGKKQKGFICEQTCSFEVWNYLNFVVINRHTLYGALVGGPSDDDTFRDQRTNEKQNSVTIDFNAG